MRGPTPGAVAGQVDQVALGKDIEVTPVLQVLVQMEQRLQHVSEVRGAFWECKALASVRLPDTVTTLGASAFSERKSLKDIYFDGGMPSMGEDIFYRTDVTVHYLSIHSGSWEPYEGKAVVDDEEGPYPETPDDDKNAVPELSWIIAVASAAAISGIALYAMWRRGRR